MSRWPIGVAGGVWFATISPLAALPVFVADNHAESLGWVSRSFDLDRSYVLVLTDAHSDASAIERSEEVREGLRRVASEQDLEARVEAWRANGRIQAFNWIEPLMPRPFNRVVWVPGESLSQEQSDELRTTAGRQCDGRLVVEPRAAGRMADRWEVMDVAALEKWEPGGRRIIWSVDLDFFAGMSVEAAETTFARMWSAAMDWPGLEGVCVAVSRPWLKSDDEADRLVGMVLEAASRTRGARVEIEAAVDDRPDASLRAAEGFAQRWNITASSLRTRSWMGVLGDRCIVRKRGIDEKVRFAGARIEIDGVEMDVDGVWRLALGDPMILRVRGAEGSGRVKWSRLETAREAYDLLPATGLGKGFSKAPGRWIFERPVEKVETTDFALDATRWIERVGVVRVSAEVETGGDWQAIAPVEIRVGAGKGFRRALSECMGMPYVFGIAGVEEDDLTGVESGWGADCSNLLSYGWRRCGRAIGWGDPEGLRVQLKPWPDRRRWTPEEVDRGVMVDLGFHVAALWEDRKPEGELNGDDLVFHHLGGRPQVVRLESLLEGRRAPRAWVLTKRTEVRLRVAGDVVLTGAHRRVRDDFQKGGADAFVANLEGVPTRWPAAGEPRFDFRFPPERLGWLRERGVDAVSLANNHAGDAGREGLADALARLEEAGVDSFGAGLDATAACRPWICKMHKGDLACFGVSLTPALVAGEGPGVAALPEHATVIEREMRAAVRRGETVIVLVHWGDEYVEGVNAEQRRWARWLVRRGARLIAGSGPHMVQRREIHGGARIWHSLGNAVYPEKFAGMDGGIVGDAKVEVGR